MISERRHAILGLIIEHYLRTGEPIGSKTLCQLLPYSISSATIRNEMAYLTQLGFLEQRHTSGGRVPSKASYRYYVDNIMQEKPISKYETDKINEALSVNSGDPERLLADACKLLEEYSHCAAFCATLEDPYDCIQGVDLIPAGNQKAMLVMLTVGSKIKSSLINMPCALDEDFRKKFYEVSAKFLTGTPLTNVNLALIQSAVGVAGERIFDMLPALSSLCALCNEASHSKLTLEGETNLPQCFFENVRRYNQDCQTDSTHNQCIRIYRIDISNKCFQLFHGLDRFYPIRIGKSEEIFQLSDYNCNSNSGSESGCDRKWDEFDQTSEMAQSHQNQKDTGEDCRNDKSIHSVFGNNAGDDCCECSRWSGNLYTASAKCRDDKSGNDRSEDTSFRSYTGCKCQCD